MIHVDGLVRVFLFLIIVISDLRVARVKYYSHPRIYAKMVQQKTCSTAFVEFGSRLAEEWIDGKVEVKLLHLQLCIRLDKGGFCAMDLRERK